MDNQCKTCGMQTDGYKCVVCGEESAEHDAMHTCGSEELQPKCTGCNLPESTCSC